MDCACVLWYYIQWEDNRLYLFLSGYQTNVHMYEILAEYALYLSVGHQAFEVVRASNGFVPSHMDGRAAYTIDVSTIVVMRE